MNRFIYLFNFIQNLSKSEKRFFKLYTKLYNRQKNKSYMLLFDVLEKTETHNEELLKKTLLKEIPNANFGSVKAHLKEQLFTALRLYHRNNADNPKYYDNLAMAQLLMTKGEHYYAQEILEKLEKDALQTEEHLPNIAAQTLLNQCLDYQNSRDLDSVEQSINYYDQILKQIELLKEYINIRKTYKKITQIVYAPQFNQRKEVALKKILAEDIENKALEDIEDIATKYYYLQSKFVIYDNIDTDILHRIDLLEKLLSIVYVGIEKGIFKKGQPWVALVNLANLYKVTKNRKKWYQTIQKLDATIIHCSESSENNVLYWRNTRVFEFYYDFPKEELLPNLIENTEKWLNNTKNPVNEKHKTGIRFVIARHYFISENYQDAIKQLNILLLKKDIQLNDYYYLDIKWLYIISQYEINAYTVAKKELLALKRQLRKHELATESVKSLLRVVTSIINIEDQNYDIDKYHQKIIDVFQNDKENKKELWGKMLAFVYRWAKIKLEKNKS